MLAEEQRAAARSARGVERAPQRPLEPPAERRGRGVVETDVVAIAAGDGALAGVEAGLHRMHRFDPAVRRQQRVERAAKRGDGPGRGCGEADGESDGVHAGVGSARGVGHRPPGEEPLQDPLELALNRAPGGLALPPHEPGAVEVQRGEEGPAHRPGI